VCFTLTVADAQVVKVGVFDTLGRRVAYLYDALVLPGQPMQIEFEPEGFASGIYFVRASSAKSVSTKSVTLLR
jgi:hypothetical protein